VTKTYKPPLLEDNPSKIKEFLSSNEHNLLFGGRAYLGGEMNAPVIPKEEWGQYDLSLLLCRLSDRTTTELAFSLPLVAQIIREKAKYKYRIERSWMPLPKDRDLFIKHSLPLYFSVENKIPASQFDVVGINHSVLLEAFNLPFLLYRSGIPVMASERLSNPDIPIILMGGMSMGENEWLFGDYEKHGTGGMIDIGIVGSAEVSIHLLLDFIVECKKKGYSKVKIITEAVKQNIPGVYVPWLYDVEYNDDKVTFSKNPIKSIKPKYDWVPEKVKVAHVQDINSESALGALPVPLSGRGGEVAQYISKGCPGHCSFCRESSLSKPYSDRDLDIILDGFEEAKALNGAYRAFPFSLSWSCFNNLNGLLIGLSERFSDINLISNRADELAWKPDLAKVIKKLGNATISSGVEGCSDGMRAFYQKGLSEELLLEAVKNVMLAGFSGMKFFMIYSGYETTEDILEFCGFIDKVEQMRDDLNEQIRIGVLRTNLEKVKTRFRVSFMMLVPSLNTSLQFLKPLVCFEDREVRTLDPVVEKCREHRWLFRCSIKRHEVTPENMLAIGFRKFTELVCNLVLEKGIVWNRGVDKKHEKVFLNLAKEMGIDWKEYLEEKDLNYIFPNEHIDFPVSKEFLYKMFLKSKNREATDYCLKVMQKPGKCLKCGACDLKEDYRRVLARPLGDSINFEEISKRMQKGKSESVLRVKLKINLDFRQASPAYWGNVVASAFMLSFPNGARVFNSVKYFASSNTQSNEFTPVGGVEYIDLGLNEWVQQLGIDAILDKMKSRMTNSVLLDARMIPYSESLRTLADVAIYRVYIKGKGKPGTDFISPIGMDSSVVQDNVQKFISSEYKTMQKKVSVDRDVYRMQELKLSGTDFYGADVFWDGKGGTEVVFAISTKLNPLRFLSSMLKRRMSLLNSDKIERLDFAILPKEYATGERQRDLIYEFEVGERSDDVFLLKDLFGGIFPDKFGLFRGE